MSTQDHLKIGQVGEQRAEEYLTSKQFRLIARNWRYKNHHEIDLIMVAPNGQIVGVEVRTHNSFQKYLPFESIHPAKINRIKSALQLFHNQTFPDSNVPMRIDVVSVVLNPERIEHFENVDLD